MEDRHNITRNKSCGYRDSGYTEPTRVKPENIKTNPGIHLILDSLPDKIRT